MTYEMPLPKRVEEIDRQIQSLRLFEASIDALQAFRESLPEIVKAVGEAKDVVRPDTVGAKDLVTGKVDPETGELDVGLDTSKIDPSQIDPVHAPADVLAEAIRAQEFLEELAEPFGEHNSKLLDGMKKLASGLEKGSELFGEFQDGIATLEKAASLVERFADGKIGSEELIDAFDTYFGLVLGVLEKTVGRLPVIGDFLQAYAAAISSVVPVLHQVSDRTAAIDATIQAVKIGGPDQATADEPTREDPKAHIERWIDALERERLELLDEHQRQEAERARREIDQLERKAREAVERRTHRGFSSVDEAVSDLATRVYVGIPMALQQLRDRDPKDPRIDELERALGEEAAQLREATALKREMDRAFLEELERLVRTYPAVLQNADLVELENRYPALGDVIDEIRRSRASAEVRSTSRGRLVLAGGGILAGALLIGSVVVFGGRGGEDSAAVAAGGSSGTRATVGVSTTLAGSTSEGAGDLPETEVVVIPDKVHPCDAISGDALSALAGSTVGDGQMLEVDRGGPPSQRLTCQWNGSGDPPWILWMSVTGPNRWDGTEEELLGWVRANADKPDRDTAVFADLPYTDLGEVWMGTWTSELYWGTLAQAEGHGQIYWTDPDTGLGFSIIATVVRDRDSASRADDDPALYERVLLGAICRMHAALSAAQGDPPHPCA